MKQIKRSYIVKFVKATNIVFTSKQGTKFIVKFGGNCGQTDDGLYLLNITLDKVVAKIVD